MEDTCYGCHKAIVDVVTSAFDVKWHPTCFVCFSCEKKLESKFFIAEGLDKKGVCGDCYEKSDKCSKCKKPMWNGNLKALNKLWHEECLQCISCKKRLKTENIYDVRGSPVCEGCIHQFRLNV